MLTVAWLLHEEGDTDGIEKCGFERLSFAKDGDEPFEIEVPRLTYRERLALDRLLPEGSLEERPESIEVADAEAYSLLYRQMPIYVDAVI